MNRKLATRHLLIFVLFVYGGNAFGDQRKNTEIFFENLSENFVHRWGIQKVAQHVFDPRLEAFPTDPDKVATVDPDSVKPGDIIFVRDIRRFIKELHPRIINPYLIVTAGDYKDKMLCDFIDYLDDKKIIAWFCVHPCSRKHPKYYWLPLGIFQAREYHKKRSDLASLFELWRSTPKKKLLCCNFSLRPKFKPDRNPIFDVFAEANFCDKPERKPFLEYMKEMSEYKFTLSPRGLGPDCYRTWEAMLVGCVPVLHSCYLDKLYAKLPVLFVDKWEDVTPSFLERKYKKIVSKKYNLKKLFMEYWWKKILKVRDDYLQSTVDRKS